MFFNFQMSFGQIMDLTTFFDFPCDFLQALLAFFARAGTMGNDPNRLFHLR